MEAAQVNAQTQPLVAPPGNGTGAAATRPAGAAEQHLLAAAQRAVRHPHSQAAVVVRLSALYPPAPRPHHLRIARALMHDVAQRQAGQIFALRNGDTVLLCAAAEPTPPTSPLVALPATLDRLFRRDATDPSGLVSVWSLPAEARRLLEYAAARLDDGAPAAVLEDAPLPAPGMVDALDAAIAAAQPADLLRRQTAVLLAAAPRGPAPERGGISLHLQPIYQEIGFAMDLVDTRVDAAGQIARDPLLLQHLAARLDPRLLHALHGARGRGGPLDPSGSTVALHVNMTLSGLLSDGFAALAAACREAARPLAAELALVEAAADPAGYARARRRATELGVALVLDGVSHLALLLASPWLLRPDLFKLDWSPRLPDLTAAETAALRDAIARIGPARLVLHRTDTDAAIRWGVANGIRRFQGRQVDAMLGAARMASCPAAAACTPLQCRERAAAAAAAGRAGCANLPLLDAAVPA